MNNKLKTAIILTLLVVATGSFTFAETYRVNNNTGVTGTGVYTTIESVYAVAVNDDTLLFEGSNTSYGDYTFTKKLIIFGPGYHLNQNTQTQANLLTATLGNLTFNAGSEGSIISGCVINSITVNADDITIARNYVSNSTAATASILLNSNTLNTIIQQNIVWGLITNTANKTPQAIIRNNLLCRIYFTETVGSNQITNNTFFYEYSQNQSQDYSIDVYNSTISNNIIWSAVSMWPYTRATCKFNLTQGNTITYNILDQPDPANGVGSNNQFSVSMATVFGTITVTNVDKYYAVTAGSVAETGGQGGTLCGMFGGSFAYILSGMPPIPHIYMLDADPAGTNTDPLNVKISVKSQN